MKKTISLSICLLHIFFFSVSTAAQNIQVHDMIGKKQSEVIKKYGAPVHKDNSNSDMQCIYYKTSNNTMIFVADLNGVYQTEATKTFDTEPAIRKEIDMFISNSLGNGFSIDTVTTFDFHLHKKGTKVDLQMSENKLTKKFEIRVKANRVED